jgi:hypothetical protein
MFCTLLVNNGLPILIENKIKIKKSKTMSLVNDCQGVSFKASPKQPQSYHIKISRVKG